MKNQRANGKIVEAIYESPSRTKIIRIILLVCSATLFFSIFASAGNGTTSAGEFLREEKGAKLSAYGGIGSAINGDLFAIQTNPAAIADMKRFGAAFEYDKLFLDVSSSYAALGGAWRDLFSWGMWAGGINYGSTLRTTVNDPFGASSGSFTGQDIAAGFVAGGKIGFEADFNWGAGIKYYRFTIDKYSADGFAVDAGLQWKGISFGDNRVRFGASILNVGSSATFMREREDLPLSWRLGSFFDGKFFNFGYEGGLELVGGRNEASHARIGVGVKPIHWLCLRIGSNTSRDFDQGFSTGFGVSWNDLNFDYAYIPYGDFGSRNKVSLSYSWGKPDGEKKVEPVNTQTYRSVERPAVVYRPVESSPLPRTETPQKNEPQISEPSRTEPQRTESQGVGTQHAETSLEERSANQLIAAPAKTEEYIPRSKTISELVDEEMNAANKLVSEGMYEPAIQKYFKALQLDPQNVKIVYNLATAQMLAKKYEEAASSYTKVTILNPSDAEAFLYLGVCHFNAGHKELAANAWKKTLELDPTNEMAKTYLSLIR